jgi:hypothetical protein
MMNNRLSFNSRRLQQGEPVVKLLKIRLDVVPVNHRFHRNARSLQRLEGGKL